MKKGKFYNLSRGMLSLSEVVREIIKYILKEPQEDYHIIVGCDSSSEKTPVFPVVIVVRRMGRGGRFFVKKIRFQTEEKKFYNLHSRILQEVYLSCQVALDLEEELLPSLGKNNLQPRCQFRYIHADVGGDKVTKAMIKEVVNLIKSNGFDAKVKPESYAASSIADRFT